MVPLLSFLGCVCEIRTGSGREIGSRSASEILQKLEPKAVETAVPGCCPRASRWTYNECKWEMIVKIRSDPIRIRLPLSLIVLEFGLY